jgi:hypothetical protein
MTAKYRAIINDLGDMKLLYLWNGYKHKHEATLKGQGNSLNFRWQH